MLSLMNTHPAWSALPEYYYNYCMSYDKTPLQDREVDDWQPRTHSDNKTFFQEKVLFDSSDTETSVSTFVCETLVILLLVRILKTS